MIIALLQIELQYLNWVPVLQYLIAQAYNNNTLSLPNIFL